MHSGLTSNQILPYYSIPLVTESVHTGKPTTWPSFMKVSSTKAEFCTHDRQAKMLICETEQDLLGCIWDSTISTLCVHDYAWTVHMT